MKMWRSYLSIFGGLILASLVPQASWSQGRLFDKVVVDLPNDTHVNEQVLPAGHYEFRQVRDSAGASHVMLVTQDGASHFDAAVITIPSVNNNTPDATRVIVRRIGPAYYLDKIWIAGKDYGYEFVLPAEAKSRLTETGEPITVSANYQAEAAPQVAVVQTQSVQTQSVQTQPAPEPPAAAPPPPRQEPPVAQAPPPPPPPAREEPPVVAQNQPPPPPPSAQPPQQQSSQSSANNAQSQSSANNTQPEKLPQTSSGWANYFLLGTLATGLAILLSLRRRAS